MLQLRPSYSGAEKSVLLQIDMDTIASDVFFIMTLRLPDAGLLINQQ